MPAANASLLLTFEGLLTAVFGASLFREAVAPRVWLAMLVMIIAGGGPNNSGIPKQTLP